MGHSALPHRPSSMLMGNGAGSLSVVVPRWCHVVIMCHCHLLVVMCHGSLIAPCPGHDIVGCYRHHAPSSPCHPVSLLHQLSSCCVLITSLLSSSRGRTTSVAHLSSTSPVSVHHCPGSQQSGLGQM